MKPKPLALWLSVAALSFCLVQLAEAGKLRRLLYYNYPGANITNLYVPNSLGNQTFPSTPDAADFLPNYAPFTVSPPFIAQTSIDIANEYGSLIQGYLTAPETGDYIFWIATDDETELLMTTDPADSLNPAKTNRIAWVPGWSAPTDWTK